MNICFIADGLFNNDNFVLCISILLSYLLKFFFVFLDNFF